MQLEAVRICWSQNAAKLFLIRESASLASSVDLGELQSLFLSVDSLSTTGFLLSELRFVEFEVVLGAAVLETQLVFVVFDVMLEGFMALAFVVNDYNEAEDNEANRGDEAEDQTDKVRSFEFFGLTGSVGSDVEVLGVVLGAGIRLHSLVKRTAMNGLLGGGQDAKRRGEANHCWCRHSHVI